MARFRRIIRPGDLVHMIARLVNGEHLIGGREERQEYLRRLGLALAACDWLLLGYGLMSSHVHLDLIAGKDPFETLARRIHPPFAQWLNRRKGKRGPVFAERPSTYSLDPLQVNRLLAYVHNNPVKAGVCQDPADSGWTSHRAYVGQEPAPRWLQVEFGLQLGGFSTDPAGRAAFHDYVRAHSQEDDGWFSDRGALKEDRREAREALGRAIELAYPHLNPGKNEASYPVLTEDGVPLHPRWMGPMTVVLDHVAQAVQLEAAVIQSTSRERKLARARRLVLLMARHELGRGLSETSRLLGITPQAGSCLIQTAPKEQLSEARELARSFWRLRNLKT